MRRLFIIFLLTLLPIQAVWATACAYCPDNCLTTEVANSDDDARAQGDDNCSRCQLGGVGLLPMPGALHLAPSMPAPHLAAPGPLLASAQPDRPERPKWQHAT
jgi:hypothetical protein